jgi:hypothetical protein
MEEKNARGNAPMNAESPTERKKRLMLGCFWIGFSILWCLGSVIPVIYVVSTAP